MAFTDGLLVKSLFALAIGTLIGLERERFKKVAGIRTFMLTSLFGVLSAYLARTFSGFVLVAGAAFAASILTAYWFRAKRSGQTGLTTVLALGVCFLLGLLTESGEFFVAASIAVLMTLVLASKKNLRSFAKTLTYQELMDALKFLIATVVVLPILPDTPLDPWGVFNPFEMWLLAVLVLSLSFVSYIAMKVFGPEKGTASVGLLGGMMSSTAVTSTMAGQVRSRPRLIDAGAFAIILASSTMFVRSLLVLGALNSGLAIRMLVPFLAMTFLGWGFCLALWKRICGRNLTMEAGSSFAIVPALKFSLLYTIVSFVSFFSNAYLGEGGVLSTAVLAGLLDVDLVTTSMATLMSHGELTLGTASHAVFLGALSNTAMKWFLTLSLGTEKLAKRVGAIFLAISLLGGALFFLA